MNWPKAFLSGVGVELLVNLLQPLLHYPEWVQWTGIAIGAALVVYGSFLPLAKQAVRYMPASAPLFPRPIRDRVHWARYAPVVAQKNGVGVDFEVDKDGRTVTRCRVHASFHLRNRSPFGLVAVSFEDCRILVRPHTGRTRKWQALTITPSGLGLEMTIPEGEVRVRAVQFDSPWIGGDVSKNPRLDFDFDWRIEGITGRFIDGDLSGKFEAFKGRRQGRVSR